MILRFQCACGGHHWTKNMSGIVCVGCRFFTSRWDEHDQTQAAFDKMKAEGLEEYTLVFRGWR